MEDTHACTHVCTHTAGEGKSEFVTACARGPAWMVWTTQLPESSLGKGGHPSGHKAREGALAKWSLRILDWENIVHTQPRESWHPTKASSCRRPLTCQMLGAEQRISQASSGLWGASPSGWLWVFTFRVTSLQGEDDYFNDIFLAEVLQMCKVL